MEYGREDASSADPDGASSDGADLPDVGDRPPGQGSAPRGAAWAAVAVAAVVASGLLVWGVKRARAKRLAAERAATERLRSGLPRVTVERARRVRELRETISLSGTVRSAREVTVVPEVAGKLERVTARRGRRVAAGDVLAVIEPDTLRARVEQAKAAVAVAVAASRQADVARENARSDLKRLKGLESSGAVTDRELEAAKALLDTAEAGADLASARIDQARAAAGLAGLQLAKATVRAPVPGVIADDFLRTAGQMVSPQTPIARVVDMEALRVHARAGERELARLRPGQRAEVRVAPGRGRFLKGELLVAGPDVDPVTRTGVVEIAVDNTREDGDYPGDGLALKPGMFAEVEVTVDERRDVLAVRSECVVPMEGGNVLLVPVPANVPGVYRLEAREVTLGLRAGGIVEVVRGLEAGEPVVTSGARLLSPGAHVRLHEGQVPSNGSYRSWEDEAGGRGRGRGQ